MFKLNTICSSFFLRNLLHPPLFSPSLTNPLLFSFGKWSKPPKQTKQKERKTGLAISDEKGAKLAKEEEAEEKKRKIENEKKRILKLKIKKIPIKTFDRKFDVSVSQAEMDKLAIQQTKLIKGLKAASELEKKMLIREKKKKRTPYFLKPFLSRMNRKKGKGIPLNTFFKNPNQSDAIKPPRLKRKTSEFFIRIFGKNPILSFFYVKR